jgi:NAD(P)-dependent dehydrogenase (short-subunit alcohol dehydrogenase family)
VSRASPRGGVTFNPGLLEGSRVAVAGAGEQCIVERLRALGAWVDLVAADLLADENTANGWVRERVPLDALLFCAGEAFGDGGPEALRATLDRSWAAARAVATGALIDAGRPGRLLFLAPAPDAGPHAQAARAGLENLARTLSVEWARFAVTAVTLTPGAATTGAELADLVCFLISPAGGYFSGCRFELGAVPA